MFLTKRSNTLFHVVLDSGRLSEEARVGERNDIETTSGAVITIFLGGNGLMVMEVYVTTQQPPFTTSLSHGTGVVPLSGAC